MKYIEDFLNDLKFEIRRINVSDFDINNIKSLEIDDWINYGFDIVASINLYVDSRYQIRLSEARKIKMNFDNYIYYGVVIDTYGNIFKTKIFSKVIVSTTDQTLVIGEF